MRAPVGYDEERASTKAKGIWRSMLFVRVFHVDISLVFLRTTLMLQVLPEEDDDDEDDDFEQEVSNGLQ